MTGLVRKGQAFERLTQPLHRLDGQDVGGGVRGQPLSQRDAQGAVHRHIGPLRFDAHLNCRSQARVFQTSRQARVGQPSLRRSGVSRLNARNGEHDLLLAARVERQPRHARGAFAQQLAQLKAPKQAQCRCVRGHGRSSARGSGRGPAQFRRKVGGVHQGMKVSASIGRRSGARLSFNQTVVRALYLAPRNAEAHALASNSTPRTRLFR